MSRYFQRCAGIFAALMILVSWPVFASSPSGTIVTTMDTPVIDSSYIGWTLATSPVGLIVERNDVPTISSNVIVLAYIGGKIYQENKALGWWYWKDGKGWIATANPLTSSPNRTTVPSATNIVDGNKNVWSVYGDVVLKNGEPAGYSANVIELYYLNGVVYQENSAWNWWSWNGTTWVNATNPANTKTDNTTISIGGASPAGVTVDLSNPTSNSVPGSLWGVSTGALTDNSFAGAANASFQATAKALDIQSMRFNVRATESLWEDAIFVGGINNPNWSYLDRWFTAAPAFWNSSRPLIVGVGPSGGSAQRSPSEWAQIAVQLASHFKAKGMEVFYWEVGNEPDGAGISVNTYIADFNAIAQALHSFNPAYKVGGPVTSWANGAYVTPWAQQCGNNADFTDWHNYPVNASDSDATMYEKGISGEANGVTKEISGTAMAGKPYALLEYNINGVYGVDPRQVTYKNAVYTALRLTESFKQTPQLQFAGIWDMMGDSNYGIVGPNGSANSMIVPAGYYLGKAGQVMPGVQVPATVGVSGNLKVFATVNGQSFAIQIVNYDTAATYTIGVTTKLASGGNYNGLYNVWQIGSASSTMPQLTEMPYNTSLTIPPETVVILTSAQ